MTRISRRSASKLLATGFAAAGLSAVKAPAVWSQANMPKIKAAYPPVIDATIFHVGKQKGMYAAERIEVETIPSPGGAATMSAVAANEFQVGIATVTALILGAVQGLNFQIVVPASFVGSGPPDEIGGLLIRKGSGMDNGAALNGKRAGVLVLNNLMYVCTRLWIDSTGGDSSKVNFVEVPAPQMVDALIGGRVDTIASIEPFFTAGLIGSADKIEVGAYAYSKTMPGSLVGACMMAEEFTAKNKELVMAFARASGKAIDWMNEYKGKPELAQVISDFTRLPPERVLALRTWPIYRKNVATANIDNSGKAMMKYGLVDKVPNGTALIFESAKA
jgi:NitT/TauT family transport system substrate-binding protein